MGIRLRQFDFAAGSPFTLSLPFLVSDDYSDGDLVEIEKFGDRESMVTDSCMQELTISTDVDADVVEDVFDFGFVVSLSFHVLVHPIDASVPTFHVIEDVTAIVPSVSVDAIEIILVDPSVFPAVSLLVPLPDRLVSNFLREVAGVAVPLSVDDPAYVRGRAEVVGHSCDSSRRDVQELGWVRDGGVRGEPRELCSS